MLCSKVKYIAGPMRGRLREFKQMHVYIGPAAHNSSTVGTLPFVTAWQWICLIRFIIKYMKLLFKNYYPQMTNTI